MEWKQELIKLKETNSEIKSNLHKIKLERNSFEQKAELLSKEIEDLKKENKKEIIVSSGKKIFHLHNKWISMEKDILKRIGYDEQNAFV